MPTAAEIAGVKPPSGIDGISVLPTLLGKPQKKHEYLYWELPRYIAASGEFRKEMPLAAARMGDWKAVRPEPDAPVEIYNLKDDVGETRDLAKQRPDILKRMEEILSTARVEPTRQTQPAMMEWEHS
jgi:arylsulfatase A